jgi:ubiquinone biosynthesis protein
MRRPGYHLGVASSLSQRRRSIRRVREIAQVAARHGFGYAFERGPLKRGAEERSPEAVGRHLREMLDELGPTFVKFGQLLSTRPDLVPPEVAAELRKLQDAVSPFPYEDVEQVIREDLKAEVADLFEEFDPVPVAAASIGQVHLARLPTGRRVAVKVQRPTAPRRIEDDMRLLRRLARTLRSRVDQLSFIDPVALVDEFARSIRSELDYRLEARNAEAFRRNFADSAAVVVPKVYWTYSSSRVLTLELIEGVKLGELDFQALPVAERRRLAILLAETWMEMIFRHGFFHADPHPANLFVLEDGRLGLVDFGIAGSLSPQDMRKLTRLLVDAVNENVDALPRRLHELGVRFSRDQEEEFRLELREIYYRYHGAAIGEIDPLDLLREAFTLVASMHLRLPTRYALLDKTLATLGSVTTELYPEFNVFEVAEPYAADLMRSQLSPSALLQRGMEEAGNYGGLLLELPYQVHDTLEQFRDGEVEVQFRHRGLDLLANKADVVFNRLVIAIVMGATVIGAGLIGIGAKGGPHLLGVHLITWIGLAVASFLGLVLVLAIMRSGRL